LLPVLAGIGTIILGLALVVMTVRMFMTIGKGTLAPWDPTQRLVVVGVYRHVRNPMISGVAAILFGEAVALGSVRLLIWCALFLVTNLVYIPLSEEPGLIQRFGDDYRLYQQNVPRWIPRLTPWIPPTGTTGP
jgi:protein-S-isoprenylcysteine O-methyltransferase Ste14